jgi:hypothetical protein
MLRILKEKDWNTESYIRLNEAINSGWELYAFGKWLWIKLYSFVPSDFIHKYFLHNLTIFYSLVIEKYINCFFKKICIF